MTSLDETGSTRFARLIAELAAEGVTILWIAHDLAQVRAMATHVTCLDRVVLRHGPPEEVFGSLDAAQLFASSSLAFARAAS
jgi:zinc transport system ATP-binding protein